MQTYYLVLKAYRPSTDSHLVRFVVFQGDKTTGMRQYGCQFAGELGPAWEVYPEIVTREYLSLRVHYRQMEDEKWSALLR